jgi:hypothetical protein
MEVYTLALSLTTALIPLSVFEWYLHHSKDGVGIALLLYLVTAVAICGIWRTVRNRLRRSGRLAGDGGQK